MMGVTANRTTLEAIMNAAIPITSNSPTRWTQTAADLGVDFAARAAEHDRQNAFVQENYAALREHGFFKMIIPADLGGGGASYQQTSEVIRTLGRYCGSTALAFAMHTHPVAVNVIKHRKGDEQATAALRRIAENDLIIAGTGANDWLASSGEMTQVEGGYRVNAHKHFVSGSPGAQVFVTSANLEGGDGTEVLHFAIPFSSEGIEQQQNWDTLGMRATGSNDVTLDQVFVPEAAIVARRPAGEWHPMWNAIIPTAMPLIMCAYLGLTDAAVAEARKAAARRPHELAPAFGELLNQRTAAELATEDMVRRNADLDFTPSNENSSAILTRKTLAASAALRAVELAAEIVGGAGFFKGHPIERIQRDVRACHFHPLPYRRQYAFSGRIDLGVDPIQS